MATEMIKVSKQVQPQNIQDMFVNVDQIHERPTRQSVANMYYCPKVRLEFTKRLFVYWGVQVWEEVPVQLCCAPSLNTFKNQVKAVK